MAESLVVVDAACDVPDAMLHNSPVVVLPLRICLPTVETIDRRHPQHTLDWLERLPPAGPVRCRAEAPSAREIASLLLSGLKTHGPQALALHACANHSPMHSGVRDALGLLAQDAATAQHAAGIVQQDSASLAAGYGVQLIDLLEQRQRALTWPVLMQRAQRNARNTHTFIVPSGLDFALSVSAASGMQGLGRLRQLGMRLLGKVPILYMRQGSMGMVAQRTGAARAREVLLTQVRRSIRENRLLSPHVVLSYGGKLSEVEIMPGYQQLVSLAQRRGVSVHLAMMSLTNALLLGPRALSVGFIARQKISSDLVSLLD